MRSDAKILVGIGLLLLATGSAFAASETGYHVIDRLAGPDGKWDYISIDEQNGHAFIAHGDHVMSVNLKTKEVNGNFAQGSQIHTALPVNKGAQVLITNGQTDTVALVNGKTGALEATIPTGKKPDAASYDPATQLVLVMDHAGGDVTLIDTKERKAVGSIAIGGTLEAAAVDGHGLAYVNIEDRNQTAVVDIRAARVLRRYDLDGCNSPTGIAFAPGDHLLVIACDGSAQIRNAEDGKLVKNFKIGGGADGVAYDAADKLAFVPSGATGTLSAISVDRKNPQLVETIETQTSARTIAFNPGSGQIYLPAAKFGPTPPEGGKPSALPGSFEILVVGK